MNVISTGLVRQIGLDMHSLSEIGFRGLTMRTADHRETLLEHWVWLNVGVEGVWRSIRCFVAPELVTLSGEIGYLGLIIGIPWLWSVNVIIAMRDSKILVGDPSQGEANSRSYRSGACLL